MGQKKYLVVMTNGDGYNVSESDFEKTQAAMKAKDAIVEVIDRTNKLKLTLLVENISAAVEREVRHA